MLALCRCPCSSASHWALKTSLRRSQIHLSVSDARLAANEVHLVLPIHQHYKQSGLRRKAKCCGDPATRSSCRTDANQISRPFVSSSAPSLFASSSWNVSLDRPSWSDEWKSLGLGAQLVDTPRFPTNLFFVQLGFGVDQHGDRNDATKAAIRAVRNAIEFNSIPGVIEHLPGGRHNMLIHVKLGVPDCGDSTSTSQTTTVDVLEVAKVFPYGKLLPIQVSSGGLDFATGRVVEELGDTDDVGICVVACVSIGYDRDVTGETSQNSTDHKTYNTKDGY